MYESVNRISFGSDNGFSPIRRQAIIWTSSGLLPIGSFGTPFSVILIELKKDIHENESENIVCERRPFFPVGDELILLLFPCIPLLLSDNVSPAKAFYSSCEISLWQLYYLNDLNCFFSPIIHQNDINLIATQIKHVLEMHLIALTIIRTWAQTAFASSRLL